MKGYIVVMCTTKNIEEAREIAKGLLAEGIASCISVVQPVESWFVWEEAIESVQEVQLFIKAKRENYVAIEKWIVANHSYEVPEILALPIEQGLPAYLNWVENT